MVDKSSHSVLGEVSTAKGREKEDNEEECEKDGED